MHACGVHVPSGMSQPRPPPGHSISRRAQLAQTPAFACMYDWLRLPVQEVAAPFVLGEVQCDGTEERLVDCSAPARPREDFLVQGCEPFTDTYAGVSCGSLAGVGALLPPQPSRPALPDGTSGRPW